MTVGDGHGERVGLVECRGISGGSAMTGRSGWGVGEVARGGHTHRAFRGGGRAAECQGVTIGVGCGYRSCDHAGGTCIGAVIAGDGGGLVRGLGCRADGDGDQDGCGAAMPVDSRHREGVGLVSWGGLRGRRGSTGGLSRDVGEGPGVCVDADSATATTCCWSAEGKGIAVGVGDAGDGSGDCAGLGVGR